MWCGGKIFHYNTEPKQGQIKHAHISLDLFHSLFNKMPTGACKRRMANHSVDQFISPSVRRNGKCDKCHDTWALARFQMTVSWTWSWRRMPSSGMLRHVSFIRTDVLEENIASIIRVTKIGELGSLAVTSNQRACWKSVPTSIYKTGGSQDITASIRTLFTFM
jgi:hypothetical protein